jgi:histone arginine demethylase JMJD6
MTSAWVALVEGLKLWCLFPRGTEGGKIGVRDGETGVQVSSSIWFKDYFWKFLEGDMGERPHVVLQRPGETVYVPSGWYHLVLNLEHSTAVTHNYAEDNGEGSNRVEEMWDVVKKEEGEFAVRWRKGLKEKRPDLEERLRIIEHREN